MVSFIDTADCNFIFVVVVGSVVLYHFSCIVLDGTVVLTDENVVFFCSFSCFCCGCIFTTHAVSLLKKLYAPLYVQCNYRFLSGSKTATTNSLNIIIMNASSISQ